MTNTMATDWAGNRSLNITAPEGRIRVDAAPSCSPRVLENVPGRPGSPLDD